MKSATGASNIGRDALLDGCPHLPQKTTEAQCYDARQ